jgi:hypothetical protein
MKNCSISKLFLPCFFTTIVFLLSSCNLQRGNLYPTKIDSKIYNNILNNSTGELFLSFVDTTYIKTYSLGKYLIIQSVLEGPSGISSNFYHYLIFDTMNSQALTFMSISNNIGNVYIRDSVLYVDIIDYKENFEMDEDYFEKKNAIFLLKHNILSNKNFELEMIKCSTIVLLWEDAYSWPQRVRGRVIQHQM